MIYFSLVTNAEEFSNVWVITHNPHARMANQMNYEFFSQDPGRAALGRANPARRSPSLVRQKQKDPTYRDRA
jgi:hypothetical protein